MMTRPDAVADESALAVGGSPADAGAAAAWDFGERPVLGERPEGALGGLEGVPDHGAIARSPLDLREQLVVQKEADLGLAVLGVVAGEQDEVVPDLVDVLGWRHGTVVGRTEIEELLHLVEQLVRELWRPADLHDHALLERRMIVVNHPRAQRRILCPELPFGQGQDVRLSVHVSPHEIGG